MNKLEESTSAEIAKNVELKMALNESEKAISFMKFTRGMTEIQAGKLGKLVESEKFVDDESFTSKLKILSESVVAAPAAKAEIIMEDNGAVLNTQPEAKPLIEEASPMSIVDIAVAHARAARAKI